ncbi:MAG TPA: aspartate-semialdehyde dehydrogenase [Actinomycetota bacterium]|nr:aspartate-semialdehyde dehydrogenase [Actinomycetota bacterium]
MRVAVVGATGAVGREMLRTLEERRFPVDDLVALASPRSEGRRVAFAGSEVAVRAVERAPWDRVDLALFSAGASVSREHAPRAVAGGALVVDNSSAFRMDAAVPLVIPEINPEALDGHRGIVANPNCTAITGLMAVAPLHRAAGLRRMVVSSYQSVSGAGQRGIRELLEQVEKLRGQEEDLRSPDPEALPSGEAFGRTIAYNVLPRGGTFEPDGSTSEETKLVNESRKILGLPELDVVATVVRVPVVVGHAVSVVVELDRQIAPGEARGAIADFPGVRVVDDPASDLFPTPLDAAGRDEVLVGRIRRAGDRLDAVALFAVGDNLRKGAALNAVEIAERLAAR